MVSFNLSGTLIFTEPIWNRPVLPKWKLPQANLTTFTNYVILPISIKIWISTNQN